MKKRNELEAKLKQTFGLDKFYDDQWSTIERILRGERVLLIEKTGFGKSLCFQFPATIFKGMTVIFSPLIALMRDQVNKLTRLGISANCINRDDIFDSGATMKELGKLLTNFGALKIAPLVIARTVGGDLV